MGNIILNNQHLSNQDQLNTNENIYMSTNQLSTLNIIEDILCSCYVETHNFIIFGLQLKEEYHQKGMNKLIVFDTKNEELVSKLIH